MHTCSRGKLSSSSSPAPPTRPWEMRFCVILYYEVGPTISPPTTKSLSPPPQGAVAARRASTGEPSVALYNQNEEISVNQAAKHNKFTYLAPSGCRTHSANAKRNSKEERWKHQSQGPASTSCPMADPARRARSNTTTVTL